MKNLQKLEDFNVNEGNNIPRLVTLIDNAIAEVDSNLSYKDLAGAIAYILSDSYGSHNFKPFVKELTKKFGNIQATS
jgi:hypothetical protein